MSGAGLPLSTMSPVTMWLKSANTACSSCSQWISGIQMEWVHVCLCLLTLCLTVLTSYIALTEEVATAQGTLLATCAQASAPCQVVEGCLLSSRMRPHQVAD